jgi:N-acetylneuraminic acid mutarotase
MGSEIRLLFSLTVTVVITALFSLAADVKGVENSTWTLGEEMLTNRTEITAAILDDKIYVIGGADYRADGAVDTVEVYDPNTDQWTTGAPLPYDLDHAPSVVYDGKIYVVGGFLQDKITTDKMLIYDPATNEWTDGTPLPEPRCCHVAEVVNGTIYAISGLDFDHNPTTTNFAYNIENDTWVTKNPIPAQNGPIHHAASAVVDNKIYVLGGRLFGNGVPNEINDALTNLDNNMQYDPKTDKWSSMDPMPIRRSGFAAESLDGKIYVFGGQMADGSNKNVERYDPLTNRWTTEPSMQADRSGLAVAAYKDKLYVFGGQHQGLQALNINEILNPANNTERSTNNNK